MLKHPVSGNELGSLRFAGLGRNDLINIFVNLEKVMAVVGVNFCKYHLTVEISLTT